LMAREDAMATAKEATKTVQAPAETPVEYVNSVVDGSASVAPPSRARSCSAMRLTGVDHRWVVSELQVG